MDLKLGFRKFYPLTLIIATILSLIDQTVSNSKNVLSFYYLEKPTSQAFIEATLQLYTKTWFIHNQLNRVQVTVAFCNEIAKALNLTLGSSLEDDPPHKFKDLKYPKIITFLNVGGKNVSVKKVRKAYKFKFNNVSSPLFYQSASTPQNFIYCAVPFNKHTSPTNFISLFVDPLDKASWIALWLGFISTVLIIFSSEITNQKIKIKVSISEAALLALSGMLSPVLSGFSGTETRIKNHPLLLLWMFSCAFLVNIYCGVITTNITRPLPEQTIETFKELSNANYTTVYSTIFWLETDKKLAKRENRTDLINLLNSAVMTDNFMEELCFGYKKAYIDTWNSALQIALDAKDIIQIRLGNLNHHSNKKECHVGKELFTGSLRFITFLPPGNEKVFKVFQRFENVGIYNLWMKEFFSVARLVRDRAKVLSPTKLAVEHSTSVEATSLNPKTAMVFYILVFGLIASSFIFVFEIAVCRENLLHWMTFSINKRYFA